MILKHEKFAFKKRIIGFFAGSNDYQPKYQERAESRIDLH